MSVCIFCAFKANLHTAPYFASFPLFSMAKLGRNVGWGNLPFIYVKPAMLYIIGGPGFMNSNMFTFESLPTAVAEL